MLYLFVIGLFCFVYAKGKRAIVAYEHRPQRWREADAGERERMVKLECACRVIGRAGAAAGLGIAAFTLASPGLTVLWALTAWRVVKPIRAEMRDACAYRSTGSDDEAPYCW
jgi:hypothetical protein